MKLLLGTASGLYVLEGDAAWKRQRRRGPLLAARAIGPLGQGGAGLLAAAGDTLHTSRDGIHWTILSRVPQRQRISALAHAGAALLVGTEPAALWRAEDGGTRWREMAGLRAHASVAEWWGATGHAAIQAIATDPLDQARLFAAISIAGIFRGETSATLDASWSAVNRGLPPLYPRDSQHDEVHRDTRHLVALPPTGAAGPLLVAATSHGIYASVPGENWQPRSGAWAFRGVQALAVAPASGALYTVPQGAGDGQLTVYRSRDRARTWEPLTTTGLPDAAHSPVHRDALAVLALAGGGEAIFVGTGRGEVYWSLTAGAEWLLLARGLPAIRSVLPVPPALGSSERRHWAVWRFRHA